MNNKRKVIIVLVILIILGGLLFYYFNYYQDDNKEVEIVLNSENEKEMNIIDEKIYVDIKGYVSVPGVYGFKLSDDARINDLILKAGGLKKEADTSILNLSKKLEDEMTVIIYSKSEVDNFVKLQESLKNKLEICETKLKNNACIKNENDGQKDENEKIININTASKDELMTLIGIGESKALAIIEYRKSNPFQNIKDIMNVEGIGENLFENIKNSIKV